MDTNAAENAVRSNALANAARVLGSPDRLAIFLQADPKVVAEWLSGQVSVPRDAYLGALDVLLDESLTRKAARPRTPSP